jgi:spermidine/putrescine transport system permease protein
MSGVQRAGTARVWIFLSPALIFGALFFAAPFVVMAVASLWQLAGTTLVKSLSFANYERFFATESFRAALINSLEVTLIVTAVSAVLAYPMAWILAEKVPERWQRLALMLAILPFWTSYVVRTYAWALVLAEKGVINSWLTGSGLLEAPLQLANTRLATVIGFVHFFVMLLTLTIFANLKQLSPNYRRAAHDLGASGMQTFIHVILPLTLPGIVTGAFLTFVLCIGDYVTPQILGGNNELLMPQLIMLQILRKPDFPMASALSLLLMLTVSLAYLACARWLRLERM